jgi:hypothetical protein
MRVHAHWITQLTPFPPFSSEETSTLTPSLSLSFSAARPVGIALFAIDVQSDSPNAPADVGIVLSSCVSSLAQTLSFQPRVPFNGVFFFGVIDNTNHVTTCQTTVTITLPPSLEGLLNVTLAYSNDSLTTQYKEDLINALHLVGMRVFGCLACALCTSLSHFLALNSNRAA